MVDHLNARLEALITIVDINMDDALNHLYTQNNVPMSFLTYGYGTAKSAIYEILGYGSTRKVISISIITKHMSDFLLNEIHSKMNFSKPGTGIAFTINISSINSTITAICKQAEDKLKTGSEDMPLSPKDPYHLIITIVNTGYFEQVMEAAKSATGGTLVHARGAGSKEALKYLGITIQPEKDLVLILAKKNKHLIMEKIVHEVGLNTAGMGICFSLPVNNALGFGATRENIADLV